MGRYRKFDLDEAKEKAARCRTDDVPAKGLLFGNDEEFQFLDEQIPALKEEHVTNSGTLTGADGYSLRKPTLDFVRRYNGKANTEVNGWTHQTSQSIVSQNFDPATGDFFTMGIGDGEFSYEDIAELRCIAIKTHREAIDSYTNARAASWRYQRAAGFKGAEFGVEGAKYGKKGGRPITQVNSRNQK